MSEAPLPVVAFPYVEDGQCEGCDRVTPQLYAWQDAWQPFPDALCGWCLSKARWIMCHASALAPSWPAPDEEPAP